MGIQLQNVLTTPGLLLHSCPKVASTSLTVTLRECGIMYGAVSPLDDHEGYRWAAVRHPLDRLVSAWTFFCRQKDDSVKTHPELVTAGYYHGMPFDEFLVIVLTHHACDQHTLMQHNFIGPHAMDRLCRMENLPAEWAALQRQFPYLTKPLLVIHKTDHSTWQDYYTPQQRALAEEVFVRDLMLFESADPNPLH